MKIRVFWLDEDVAISFTQKEANKSLLGLRVTDTTYNGL